MDEIVKALFDWNPWRQGEVPEGLLGFPRKYSLDSYLQIPEIKILEGGRRTGKSTLLYQVIDRVLRVGGDILYVNFEDEVLCKYPLQKVLDAYLLIKPVRYLFLDEIQRCPDWVSCIRRLHDRKEMEQIWISGSNVSFLRNEFATLLTGRNIAISVFPLSFEEYLSFKQVRQVEFPLSSKEELAVRRCFLEYLEIGGFPAIVLRTVLQRELLTSYFEDFVCKDIASRYDVNLMKVKELGIYLATNSAKIFSYRGIAAALQMHPQTVMDYCFYFYEIFLFSELYKFDYSLKKQIGNDKKVYMIDVGIAKAVSFRFSEDMGRTLETVVYQELRRRKLEIYFHKQLYECDFLVKQDLAIVQAIQVTESLQDVDVRQRELRGLLEALKEHKAAEGLILTKDEEGIEELREGDRKVSVQILPIWKWLLGKKFASVV